MRIPDYCICENKGADQLQSNHAADQQLCFHYITSIIPLLPLVRNPKFKTFCGCTAGYMSHLDRFSCDEAHFM